MPLQLAFESIGAGPPVLILHGLFGSCRNWRSVAESLSKDYRVLGVDLRNHGRSPWAASMSYLEMADDVRMLIESERLKKPVLIGHGIGGKTAMTLALTSPASISGLVVVDALPTSHANRLRPLLEALDELNLGSTLSRAQTIAVAEKIADAAAVSALMRKLMMREEHFDWRINLAAIAAALPDLSEFPPELLLRSYDGPTMLIHGALSDLVRQDDTDCMLESFPAFQRVCIDGAGHWLHTDRPVDFLAGLYSRPPLHGCPCVPG
jgi:esterase